MPSHSASAFCVDHVDVARRIKPGDAVEHPRGAGRYVLVHFRTQGRVFLDEDEMEAAPGDCLILTPRRPVRYCDAGEGLEIDRLGISGSEVRGLIESFDLPFNRIFHPLRISFLGPKLRNMQTEIERRLPYWEDALELAFRNTCQSLRRQIALGKTQGISRGQADQLEAFRKARREILERFAEPWTLDEMARTVHLGRSRFSELYRDFFRSTPADDLLEARLSHARRLLIHSNQSITSVAEASGFRSLQHFSRMFRRRTGYTPREFGPKSVDTSGVD
jgi:AraC-like DNA-binding protein